MNSNKNFQPEKQFSLLLIGPPLSGKTNVAMGFPKPYFLSTDKKLANAVQRHPGKEFYYDYTTIDETGKAVEESKRWERLVKLLGEAIKNPEVETIVFDNLTDIGVYVQDWLLAHPCGKADTPLLIGGVKCMAQAHWRPFKTKILELIRLAQASGKYVVVCCHEGVEKDELTGQQRYVPLIGGELKGMLGAIFTDVWHCEVEQGLKGIEYKVRTQPTGRMALGTSLNLPASFVFSFEEVDRALQNLGK